MSTIRWNLQKTPDELLEISFERSAQQSASPELEPVFMELVNRVQDPLVRFIASRVRDPHHVEDLVQTTLMKAFDKRKTYRHLYSFRSWIFGIASNTVSNHFRANGRRREDPTDWSSREVPTHTADQQRALLAKEEYSTLLHQVEEERDKRLLDAWIRHKFDDQSWNEIRDDMGWNITPESLRIACFRLVKSLKRVR